MTKPERSQHTDAAGAADPRATAPIGGAAGRPPASPRPETAGRSLSRTETKRAERAELQYSTLHRSPMKYGRSVGPRMSPHRSGLINVETRLLGLVAMGQYVAVHRWTTQWAAMPEP
jgi:hypothetical protein